MIEESFKLASKRLTNTNNDRKLTGDDLKFVLENRMGIEQIKCDIAFDDNWLYINSRFNI